MAVAQSVARESSADAQLVALRVPPHSVEAEQSLLGALLIDNQAFDRIADLVAAEDFYRDDHRRIWRHIQRPLENSPPADVVPVAESNEGAEDKDKTGRPTAFTDLDIRTAGLQPGDLVIIAGRPSMGKTAFALNIAEHVALHPSVRLPVAIFSMEMSSSQLAIRMLSSIAKVDAHKLRTGRLADEEWSQLTEAMGRLHETSIHVDETPALNALEVRARARRLKREYSKLGLVIVDYLQLMSASSHGENRATEISEIPRSLKALAKELEVPVIALSQLSRAVEQRNDRRPMMSDLRESGAIEQDADVILFIYREEVYSPDKEEAKGRAEIIIGKQRNGPIGRVDLTFLGRFTRFANFQDPNAF